MRILAVSGSLRAASSNSRAIQALALLAPAGVEVEIWRGLGELPFFNPDLDIDPAPARVAAWRAAVEACDALVISSPEYAHGVAGVMKNGLDWLVSHPGLHETPVAVINATPPGDYAQAHMRDNLSVMFTTLVEAAFVTVNLRGRSETPAQIAADPALSAPLRQALNALAQMG
ncbi:NAD(P)H-dependent FMN reductase [Caulobacter ginsengisoli]|uniref:NAD(P)H-dependent FMN reductase n=1 Tax=Caulobacter ginsengisoli TaxID=400775 RepID=A0ABU0IXZ1_9CAUL|nr:NAD(P)H-dependent oxidoreductase [Caulobacter ginsengisoli]MDQ0466882.1 NAD(P)H-dependent FMN reductase [Caulobacter ginsengisoli]